MKTNWQNAETETVLALLSDSLKETMADHQLILELLLQRKAELPLELGELLEDASNAYMAMSESVSQKFLLARCRHVK